MEERKVKGTPRKQAMKMNDLVKLFVRSNHLSAGLNTQCIFNAWDAVSGVKDYTLRKFFRDGKLYITVSSSMIRSHIEFQKESMIQAINEHLKNDSLFDQEYTKVGFVKEIILK